MSHIAIDARELRTSTGRYIERLLFYLQQTKSEHRYTVLLKPSDFDGWEPTNPQFKKMVCPYKEFTIGEQLGYLHLLNRLNADLVHFPMVQQPILYKNKTITTMNDLTTVRFHNPSKNKFVFAIKQRIYAWLNKAVAKKTNKIITYSNFVKDDILEFVSVDPSKFTVTYLSADRIEDSPTPLPDLQNTEYIMYVGRPMPHKNLEALIEAFQLLHAQHPSLRLVLAGKKDANYRRIESTVHEQGIKNVLFTDFVSEGQLRWLYENCQAYVFPSLSEGFGLPGLEAMTHGAAVVSSNATCLPEVYGDAAHYFDPLSTESMADAINEVLTDKNLRNNLVSAGKLQAEKYSWQRMAKQTLSIYAHVLNEQ